MKDYLQVRFSTLKCRDAQKSPHNLNFISLFSSMPLAQHHKRRDGCDSHRRRNRWPLVIFPQTRSYHQFGATGDQFRRRAGLSAIGHTSAYICPRGSRMHRRHRAGTVKRAVREVRREVDAPRASIRQGLVTVATQVGLLPVVGVQSYFQGLHSRRVHEGDGAATKATAGHATAKHTGNRESDVHKLVEFRARDFVVVLQRPVALRHQPTNCGVILVLQCLDGPQSALILADAVAGAAVHQITHLCACGLEHLHRRIAQGLDLWELLLQQCHGFFALSDPIRIFRTGQLVLHVGVGDQNNGHLGASTVRYKGVFCGAAVDEKKIAFLAHRANILVHDTARHAGKGVLCFLAAQGLLHATHSRDAAQTFQEGRHSDLERSRRGQAASNRNITHNSSIKSNSWR
mmetsp:Transcript_10381/g.18063  ORF Transcript_10381/g.18063 Transcript_10381/m.18063 type:complete len:402 (-) Transcript_10381:423-1628(-)